MKEIKTRPYAPDKLKKVVFIQVISGSRSESVGDRKLDDHVRTIFIPESKISEPKTISVIMSSLNLDKALQVVRTPGLYVPTEEMIDGETVARRSPEDSPGPYHGRQYDKSSVLRKFEFSGTIPTVPPINHTSQSVPPTGNYNLELRDGTTPQVPEYSHPPPPPYHSDLNTSPAANRSPSPAQEPANHRKLNLAETKNIDIPPQHTAETVTQEASVLSLVANLFIKHSDAVEKHLEKQTGFLQSIEKNTFKTADHTEGVREDVDEIKKTTNDMSDDMKRDEISAEPPNIL